MKQEGVYRHDRYIYLDGVKASIYCWTGDHNEDRPHQHHALFGCSPAIVYRSGTSKTRFLEDYRRNVEKAKEKGRQEWLLNNQKLTTFFLQMSETVQE
ncbi:MAG: hypothetical protein ACLPVO_02635 [Desulfomonilaceae bacterium]